MPTIGKSRAAASTAAPGASPCPFSPSAIAAPPGDPVVAPLRPHVQSAALLVLPWHATCERVAVRRVLLVISAIAVLTLARPVHAQCTSNASWCVTCHETQGLRPVLQSAQRWQRRSRPTRSRRSRRDRRSLHRAASACGTRSTETGEPSASRGPRAGRSRRSGQLQRGHALRPVEVVEAGIGGDVRKPSVLSACREQQRDDDGRGEHSASARHPSSTRAGRDPWRAGEAHDRANEDGHRGIPHAVKSPQAQGRGCVLKNFITASPHTKAFGPLHAKLKSCPGTLFGSVLPG